MESVGSVDDELYARFIGRLGEFPGRLGVSGNRPIGKHVTSAPKRKRRQLGPRTRLPISQNDQIARFDKLTRIVQ